MIAEQSKKIYSISHKDEGGELSFEGEMTMNNGMIENMSCRVMLNDSHIIGHVSAHQRFDSPPLMGPVADMKAPESLLVTTITISVPEKYRDDCTRMLDEIVDSAVNQL